MFLRMLKHLLPNARAWRLTVNKQLRQFFEGLTGLASGVKAHLDLIWLDIFPQTTRALDDWEQQWGLQGSALTTQGRRDRLDGAWKALGGQDPNYIQTTLRNAGFDVYVHEWWVTIPLYSVECGEPTANCGEPDVECGEIIAELDPVTPTPRDPSEFLTDGTIPFGYFLNCGGSVAVCGGVQAISGAANGVSGGLLVNEPAKVVYQIPTDPAEWPYVLYIGGRVYGEKANVPVGRRDEFEALCLKICPAQQWIGLIVEYN